MKSFYKTIRDEELSLENLNESQQELLKEVYRLYETNPSFPSFSKTAFSQDSLEKMGATYRVNKRFYVDPKLMRSTVYRLVQDLASTLGMQQGYINKDLFERDKVKNNKKTLEEFLKDE